MQLLKDILGTYSTKSYSSLYWPVHCTGRYVEVHEIGAGDQGVFSRRNSTILGYQDDNWEEE